MPKHRRNYSESRGRSKSCPYKFNSISSRISTLNEFFEREVNMKDLEEVRCSVCMDYPHNAILLICSSHEKGCRPFMCDTSYRHSNCFDQYCKSFKAISTDVREEISVSENLISITSPESRPDELILDAGERPQPSSSSYENSSNAREPKLMCPLCRGEIKDWITVEPARRFFNEKLRNCACETCNFSGTYRDLRKHARSEHPSVRPSEVDPRRQRIWRRLEWQRDMGDLLSILQPSIGEDKDDEQILPMDDGGWRTFFFLIRIFRPVTNVRSMSRSRTSRARAQLRFGGRFTRFWGENLFGEPESFSGDDENDESEGGSLPSSQGEHTELRTTPE